jgi:PIN domain nuclease of toxin-antitoxin system
MRQILLDTCAVIWLANGATDRFSPATLAKLREVDFLNVSPITEWEITYKWRNGGIVLPVSPREMMATFKTAYHVQTSPLSDEVMFRAAELPLHHRDPADRFIIATALAGKMPIATADSRFAQYGVEILA